MVAQLPQRRWSDIAYGGGMTAPTYPTAPNRVQSFPLQGGFGGNTAMARLQQMMEAGQAPVPQMQQQQAMAAPQLQGQAPGVGGNDIISALGYGLASGDMGAASRLLLARKAAAQEQAAQQAQLAQAIAWLDSQDPRLGAAARANPAMIDDLMKQATTPKEFKAPEIFKYYDPETNRERFGYMGPNGVVPVGGVAPPPEEKAPQVETFYTPEGGEQKKVWDPKTKSWVPEGGVKAPGGMVLEVTPDGGVRFGPAGGQKPFNEQTTKNIGFVANATYAHNQFTPQLEKAMTDVRSAVGGALLKDWDLEAYGQSPEYQTGQLYARSFINGIVRPESGAQISEEEYGRYYKTFIPQPGNDDNLIARKREARKVAISALQAGLPKEAIERIGAAVTAGNMSTEQAMAEIGQDAGPASLADGLGPRVGKAEGLGAALQGTITLPGGVQVPWREVK